MTTKRSVTLKQFLLRVHPDHFHHQPRVHDENLRSVQLLNAFLDGSGGSNGARQVHFSLYTAAASSSDAPEALPQLRRFALALGASVETRMSAILRECGVFAGSEPPIDEPAKPQRDARFSRRRQHDHRRARERSRGRNDAQREADFGASMHDMYESLRAQSLSRARHKKAILSMKDFLAFTQAEQTLAVQQQRRNAWLSIQSVKATLQREFGLGEVATSCGWAAVHLNATLMVLLKTLRKYRRAQNSGSSLFTPSPFLRGVRIDVSSQPSGIDVDDEYRVHLNPTDVPLQWVEVIEKIDDAMLRYMAAARKSLATLQTEATAALNGTAISRGHTCAALSYRGFLQAMVYGERTHSRPNGEEITAGDSLQETLVLVVEDSTCDWRILRNGDLQVPCDGSVDDVFRFAASNRERIREQRSKWDEQQRELQQIAAMCSHALGVKSVTHADTIPVDDAILCGGNNRDLASFLRGQQLRITRLFGLDQDGCFTIPFDWHK
ncbi:hypothetical protein PybrP1_010551 [[Pythium] brassicae (nom. inval.)]|nr:hypothetical protein PybrP1_010551 [[Pythium] brassicae (nom. inval.)]